MTENAKTGEPEGKAGQGTLDRLYELAKARDSKVLDYFKENAMNRSHYIEFRKTAIVSAQSEVWRTESYVTVSSVNPDRFFAYFVIGVDDTTNKLFCHRLNDNTGEGELLSDNDVRKLMNFDTESMELNKWIRVQGDLIMRIKEQAETPEKLLMFMAKSELFSHVEEYTTVYAKNELDFIAAKAAVYDNDITNYDYNLVCRLLKANGMDDELALVQAVRGKEGSGPTVHRIVRMLQGQDAYRRDRDYLEKNEAKVVQREYDRLAGREERYTFMQAHHKITITAAFMRNGEVEESAHFQRRVTRTFFYILRPSVIKIEHEEHGTREIMIDKPSMLEFGFLNRYEAPAHRRPEGVLAQRRRQEIEMLEATMARDRAAFERERMMVVREVGMEDRRRHEENHNIDMVAPRNMPERVAELNQVLDIIKRLDTQDPEHGVDVNMAMGKPGDRA